MTTKQLPTFKGWTVDVRLKEFRRVTEGDDGEPDIEFLSFSSPEGKELLVSFVMEEATVGDVIDLVENT